MARISGVDLSKNKQGGIALTYIYGIGKTTAKKILTSNGIDPTIKVKDWNDDQVNGIIRFIAEHLKVEGELRSLLCIKKRVLITVHLPCHDHFS